MDLLPCVNTLLKYGKLSKHRVISEAPLSHMPLLVESCRFTTVFSWKSQIMERELISELSAINFFSMGFHVGRVMVLILESFSGCFSIQISRGVQTCLLMSASFFVTHYSPARCSGEMNGIRNFLRPNNRFGLERSIL